MRFAPALVALLAGAAFAAPASAATFRLTDRGQDPDVAVDEAGTGHFVWKESSASADVIRYCRVPAGQTACQDLEELVPSLPDHNFDILGRSPRVHVRETEVLVTTHRSDDRTWAFVSTDGGETFATGRPIMSRPYANPTDAVRGPGDLLFQVYGSAFQAASVYADTPEPASADLGGGIEGATGGSVALLNGGPPVVVFNSAPSGGSPRLYFRRHVGTGSYNDAASWSAPVEIDEGSDPVVRSAPSGTYLYHRVPGAAPTFVIRKWTGSGFGAAKAIEDDSGFPEAGDLAVDPAGGVHAIWGQEQASIFYRRSLDGGQTFTDRAPLGADQEVLYHPRLAFNAKHAGYAVWDSNEQGVVGAESIGASGPQPPPDPKPQKCAVVEFEVVEAIISSGCFTREGGAFVARGVPVRVNGLSLAPVSNGTRIRIDPGAKRITSDGVVVTRVGALPVGVGKLGWQFSGSSRERVTGFEAEDAGKKDQTLFGFPIKGEAFVDFLAKRSEVVLNVGLPSVFGGLRGQAVLRADNQNGVRFDGMTIRVGDARLGALEIKDLVLQYTVGGNFSGAAQLILPPNPPGAKITGSFSFKDGKFAHAQGNYKPPVPVPIGGPVAMTHLGFGLFLDPAPTRITAEIGLVAGPQVAGKAALGIEASGFFLFPAPPKPAHLHVEGVAKLANQFELGSANFDYFSNGLIKFGAKLDKPWFGGLVRPKIQIGGFIDFGSSRFSFDGTGQACFIRDDWCPADASATLSSRGIAACGKITVIPAVPSMGVAYRWGEPIWSAFKFFGCDAEQYRETPPPSPAGVAQAGTSFTVGRGTRTLSVAVRGTGGVAKVSLVRPDGTTAIASSASESVVGDARSSLVEAPSEAATYIGVERPAAGRWRLVPQPGSRPIADAKFAGGLPEPRVAARVGGSGRERVLRYRVRPLRGQVVRFAERSGSVARVLGTARGRRGELRFRPADGRAGTRTIEAIVEQDGLQRARRKVASYRAPAPARPGKPKLRLRRRGPVAIVSWRGVRGAARYDVRITVDDGRRELVFLGRRARRIKVPRIDRRTRATVAVTARRADLRAGPTARVRIRR